MHPVSLFHHFPGARGICLGQVDYSIVPVENSIEGSVTVTLDTLWRLDQLRIQHALVLPISHALVSNAKNFNEIQKVYSHPQALAQCQLWLGQFIPSAQLIPANSTTEALQYLEDSKCSSDIFAKSCGTLQFASVSSPH